ncbi:MAG: hypothetical protein U9M89_00260 [Patescibacteria group bacterium]|nr:hypothetical protein [Patescibacteria group bacterium]
MNYKINFHDVFSLALAVVVGSFLSTLAVQNPTTVVAGDNVSKGAVYVSLNTNQPTTLVDKNDQWLARFDINSDITRSVSVTGATFYLVGTLQRQVISFPTLHSLTITSPNDVDFEVTGEEWVYDGTYIKQTIEFDEPFIVDIYNEASIDVYMDLAGEEHETVGIILAELESNQDLGGLPQEGKLFSVAEGGF